MAGPLPNPFRRWQVAAPHAKEMKFRGDPRPRKTSRQKIPPTERIDAKHQDKRQATSRSCGDRVPPVSQYAGAWWETSCGCVLRSSGGRLAITVPRYNRDIMVARRASFRQGAPESYMPAFLQPHGWHTRASIPYHSDTSAQLKRMCFAVIITAWHLSGNSRNQVGRRQYTTRSAEMLLLCCEHFVN